MAGGVVRLSLYLSRVADVGAIYGAFASPIVLVGWLWLTNVAMLFGAELNAEIERQKELAEGVPLARHPQPPRARRIARASLQQVKLCG